MKKKNNQSKKTNSRKKQKELTPAQLKKIAAGNKGIYVGSYHRPDTNAPARRG